MHRAMVFQSLLLLQLLLLFSLTTATAKRLHTIHPRLSPIGPRVWLDHPDQNLGESVQEDFETFFYNQTLDHFNYRPESYKTFPQQYLINSKHWGGSGTDCSAPIFVYLGAEAPISRSLGTIGFLVDTAVHFKSLVAYVEHRYYGESIPFGKEAFENASTLGYFNSAQAIADYAEIITHIKKKYQAENAPVIVIGGSYGGMLASWLRLKYPHITLGALASSAPVLYFDDITPHDGFYSIVSKGFRDASETCYQTIRKSWDVIDEVASKPDGLSELSKRFNTCKPLKYAWELKNHLFEMYYSAAQYNAPPTYRVNKVCEGIDGGGSGDDVLGKIFRGLVAYKDKPCYVNAPAYQSALPGGWTWQRCSEMVMPLGIGNDSMFQPKPFDIEAYTEDCKQRYGVPPRADWVTSYYGGHNISLVLQRFGSNIIYSNGLADPYSIGGVLRNISDTIVAVNTVKGSHCLDIAVANSSTDPDWLVDQRNSEINIIQKWIDEYYHDARCSTKSGQNEDYESADEFPSN